MTTIVEDLKNKFSGKKVLVVGLGLQGGGLGVAKFFNELGAKVKVTDRKTSQQLDQSLKQLQGLNIEITLGEHKLSDFLEADVIFKGPSVPWDLPQLKAAQRKGIPVEMETSFFASYCPAKIIGITGTRGKTTTTMMIYELLKTNGLNPYLAGNIPQTPAINLLKTVNANDWVILELSSWQLSGFASKKISPHIAVFTNLYPDHLNLYDNMNDYFSDKKAIFSNQKEDNYLVINESLKTKINPQEVKSKIIYFNGQQFNEEFQYLKGEHNKENAAAALVVANILNLDSLQCINTLKSFQGIPYRQQIIGKKDNIIFINDTTSTTPTATIKAIDAFADKPIYLILGGNSKNLPFDHLINELNKVKKIILLAGTFTREIESKLKEKYIDKITETYSDLEKAVLKAYKLAKIEKEETYVLFSPGATSFAMFDNEFHRGEEFNRIVKNKCV